jgi:hypothetical protein
MVLRSLMASAAQVNRRQHCRHSRLASALVCDSDHWSGRVRHGGVGSPRAVLVIAVSPSMSRISRLSACDGFKP